MIGAILAGGRSSRMGVDKAAVEVSGRPMLRWVAEAIEPVSELVVVAGRPQAGSDLPAIADVGGSYRGPLAGLVAVMRSHPGAGVLLVAVDQPWMRTETARRLVEQADDLAAVPVDTGIRQTTCAVYPPGVAEIAETELAEGGSLQSLLDVVAFRAVLDWRDWREDGRSWFSVDSLADLAAGLERFGPPG